MIDQPRNTRQGEELPVGVLQSYLQEKLQINAPLEVLQFPSGYSNLTYLLKMGNIHLVLRRPPFGAEKIAKGHDMGREYNILNILFPVYPKVPKPLLYCDDVGIIGANFYVMERIEGVIIRARQDVDYQEDVWSLLCKSFISQLANLHSLDLEKNGLSQLGKPEGYLKRQVEGWIERYKKSQTDDVPEMEQLLAWLPRNMPQYQGVAMLHNDYKFDNLVLSPENPSEIKAILDWEMATIGDPLSDLGLALAYYSEPQDHPVMLQFGIKPQKGMWSRQELVQAYQIQMQRQIPDSQLVFYYAFGLFKIAVIVQQIYARFKQGFTKDERFAMLIFVLKAASEMAVKALESQKISK